jgi:hypothetical protein
MAVSKQVTARSTFPAEIGGRVVIVIEGARFPATHPVVKEHPEKFKK